MGLKDDGSWDFFKGASPANSAMFSGRTRRIYNSELQLTEALSSRSEQQIRLLRKIQVSQNEVMSDLLSKTEQNEQDIVGLQNVTEGLKNEQERLTATQQKQKQDIQTVKAKVEELKKTVQILQQQQQQREQRALRNVLGLEKSVPKQGLAHADANDQDEISAPPSAIFTDIYGRRRRLCRYCGQNFGASYCITHENKRLCRRPRV